jgi:hypothetical protein
MTEDDDVKKLFANLRTVAKAEEAELAGAPADVLAPLSAADRSEIAAAILRGTPQAAAKAVAAEAQRRPEAARPRGRGRFWAFAILPVAAAAALVLIVRPFATHSGGGGSWPALPGYDVTAESGIKDVRGAGEPSGAPGTVAALQRVARDTELTVVARPATAVDGPIAVRAFVVEGGAAKEIVPRVDSAPSGAVQLRVRPGEALAGTPGHAELRAVVGRPDAIQGISPADAAGAPSDTPARHWLTVPLEVVAP